MSPLTSRLITWSLAILLIFGTLVSTPNPRRRLGGSSRVSVVIPPAGAATSSGGSVPLPRAVGSTTSGGKVFAPSDGTSPSSVTEADPVYPVAWYDSLTNRSLLPDFVREGANVVMPYYDGSANVDAYLAQAESSGVRVFLELPRDLVKNVDLDKIAAFVSSYEGRPALLGWYLADEPSINHELGPLSPQNATAIYRTIKSQDPHHPVAIAFAAREDATPYRPAMDTMMFDDYPCLAGSSEFDGFDAWTQRLSQAESDATGLGFYPIIQAFSEHGTPVVDRGYRFPTSAEERYMVFTAIEDSADGVFFWSHPLSGADWISSVLEPLTGTLDRLRPALARGVSSGVVSVDSNEVRAAAFEDPRSGMMYIIAVHSGPNPVTVSIHLHGAPANARSASVVDGPGSEIAISGGRFTASFGPYGAEVFGVHARNN